jgi:two-component system, OmpR family, sensor kinase
MMPARPVDVLATRKLALRGAMLLIIAALVLTSVVSMFEMRAVLARDRALVNQMLSSVELVSRLSRDVDEKRLLVDAHIFEKRTQSMSMLEANIAKLDADYAAAAGAYEPLARLTSQERAWQRLQDDVSAIERPLERTLDLSRKNQDTDARAAMVSIESRFDAIARTADSLIKTNHDEANRTLAQVRSLQLRATLLLVGITAAGTLAALFVAAWMTRALKRRDEEVLRASLRLEEQNRELDAFSGRVAHDLRGPLSTISLAVSRLAKHVPQEEGSLPTFRRGVARMEQLIQDLLALSRIDAESAGAASETATVVAAVEEELRPTVERANGRLRVDVAPAMVRCKDGLLHQVLWNLGENAVNYRCVDRRLEVGIEGRELGPSYELRVSDNGPGMSPEEACRVFEPFFRGEETRSSIPGTGLGLSIVRRIVEASDGTVSVESQIGRGSTFVIRLPLARREARFDSDAPAPAGR